VYSLASKFKGAMGAAKLGKKGGDKQMRQNQFLAALVRIASIKYKVQL